MAFNGNGNLTGSSQYFNDYRVYNGVATTSLRFEPTGFLELTRTSSPADTNNKIKTLSMWVKRATLSTSQPLFSVSDGSNEYYSFYFDTNNKLNFVASQSRANVISTNVFRDVSAWYHITLVIDTTQVTDTNRIKLFVNNGSNVISPSSSIFPQKDITTIAYIAPPSGTHYPTIGDFKNNSSNQLSGYLSEVNMIDGQALDPTYFGETKNGVWIPIKYTGSYGTNGFRLQFNQTGVGTASTSTIGADTSGNTHHFTSSGIVASDCAMPDSPENNFATIEPLSSGAGVFSEGNLKYVSTADTGNTTFGISSGKAYAEVYVSSVSNSFIGVLDISNGLSPTRGGNFGTHGAIAYKQDGDQYSLPIGGSSATASYGASYSNGDIIGIALNVDDDTITFYKNGSSQSATTNGVSHISSNGVYGILLYASGTNFICNFGQDPSFAGSLTGGDIGTETPSSGAGVFKYAPPSGFLALCTANLEEPTIGPNSATQADDYFNTVLYAGNGSGQSITGVGFQPDWVWAKERSSGSSHQWYDSSRGVTNRLESDNSGDEDVIDGVTSFDTDGFTIGTHSAINDDGITNVAWNWKANGGTTTTNDASATNIGSIDSVIQANTTAGFSIVTYTGTGSAGTVAHGVQVNGVATAPKMLIVRNRTEDYNWKVYHAGNTSAPETDYLVLDTTDATADNITHWADTEPTDSVFSLGTSNALIKNNNNFVAYCFADVEGYSKFGSYTGNAADDGTFVYLGFKPAWIIIKCSSATSTFTSWAMYDNKRKTFNDDVGDNSNPLYANQNAPEGERGNGTTDITGNAVALDFLSNGFKCRDNASEINASQTFVYMAFAEAPFKYANAE